MKQLFILLASVAVAFVSAVHAGDYSTPAKAPVYVEEPDEPTGYVFAYGGFAFGHETNSALDLALLNGFFGDNGPEELHSTAGLDNDYDGGYILGGGVGVYSDFMNGSRFELEGLHSSKDLNTTTIEDFGEGSGELPIDGDIDTQAFFFNIVKEFPIGRMTGYVGGGFGVANTEWSLNLDPLIPIALSGSDISLAYQFKVGVDVPVGERLSIFTEYKLIGVTDREYSVIIIPVSSEDYISHHVVFGARIGF